LDCFPERRGLASSGYVAIQQFGNFLLSALLVPLLGSTTMMAICMAALQLLGLAMFVAASFVDRGGLPAIVRVGATRLCFRGVAPPGAGHRFPL
jgi:hypothetical protein